MVEPGLIEDFDKNIEDFGHANIFSELCKKHSKTSETFCRDCNVTFCSECKLHDDHDIQNIVDLYGVYSRRQKDIERKIESWSSELKTLEINLPDISEYMERTVQAFKGRKKLLQGFLEEIMDGNIKYLETCGNKIKEQRDLLSSNLEKLRRGLEMHEGLKTIKDAEAFLKLEESFHGNKPLSLDNGIFPFVNFLDNNECKNVLKLLCGTFSFSPCTVLSSPKARTRELVHLEGISSAYHLCVRRRSTNFLVSDNLGNLLNVDKKKKQRTMIQTTPSNNGYFTSTLNGDIIFYIDFSAGKVIKICADTKRETIFSEKKYWHLRCLALSADGTDIIIGMASYKEECKLSRLNKDGQKTWDIRLQKSVDHPVSKLINICENINGDVCMSLLKSSVISVEKNGNIRFSYAGHESKSNFFPGGICTDNNGRIVICNSSKNSSSIHLIDENGVFLGILLTKEQCVSIPLSVFIDKSLMFVGWFEQRFLTCYNLE